MGFSPRWSAGVGQGTSGIPPQQRALIMWFGLALMRESKLETRLCAYNCCLRHCLPHKSGWCWLCMAGSWTHFPWCRTGRMWMCISTPLRVESWSDPMASKLQKLLVWNMHGLTAPARHAAVYQLVESVFCVCKRQNWRTRHPLLWVNALEINSILSIC